MSKKQLSLLADADLPAAKKSAATNKKASDLSTTLQADVSKSILQLLSVIYQPISTTPLISCLNRLGIKTKNGKQLTSTTIKTLLKKLISKGLVIESNKKYFCAKTHVEKTTREAINDGVFKEMSSVVQKLIPLPRGWRGNSPTCWEQAVRELRIALYLGNEIQFAQSLNACEEEYSYDFHQCNPLHEICFKPFDPVWFSQLSPQIMTTAIMTSFNLAISTLENIDDLVDWLLDSHNTQSLRLSSELAHIIAAHLLLKGKVEQAKELLEITNEYHKPMLHGWISFLEGNNDIAIEQFEYSLKILKKTTKKRKIFIDKLHGAFFILALIRRGKPEDLKVAEEHVRNAYQMAGSLQLTYWMFIYLLEFNRGKNIAALNLESLPKWPNCSSAIEYYLEVLMLYWIDKNSAKKHYAGFKKFAAALKKSGMQWMLAESYELLAHLDKKEREKNLKNAALLQKSCGFKSIIDVVKTKEPWERALEAMSNLSNSANNESNKKQSRLVWILDIQDSELLNVIPKEQKTKAKGGWTVGRQVGLRRLADEHDSFDCLTDQDIAASKAIVYSRDYWGSEYEIDEERLLPSLVGHPYLFNNDKNGTHIELVKGAPEILVEEKGKKLIIKMSPDLNEDLNITLVEESKNRWKVIECTPEQRQLSALIGESLTIPKEAKDKVLASMSAVAPFVDIHSDIGGGMSEAENVDADSTTHLLLSPLEEGLKIEARTQIFGGKGPYYRPGDGGKTIIAEVDGKRLQATRDLKLERKNIQSVMDQCPQLANIEMSNEEWSVFDPESCLEILLELKEQDGAIVSWPEGEKLKINQTVSLADFKMVIKKENDWFSASGELKLDDGQVLNMKRLMELTAGAKGRFISLADGQYLALTETFKSRMSELHSFGEERDDKVALHPLAAIALDDMASEAGTLKSDKGWKSYIARFHEAMKLEPEVPSTLQAELRDYQKEGFQWLVRLSHWGVGACLADDMGLGKTVQAIALLLHRANTGPALVVAPTSVAMNWIDEIARFAPTLNIIDYRESKRDEVLNNAGDFDIVICSYGLIQNNISQIESVEWGTVILDEAQAIKNSATKRSRAVMQIKADVKIVMTGTPIENHLGELWNLFRFINPGLLGSMEKFNNRYANPIVKDESVDVRHKLKKLIQPYILRRTKTQVLKELPPRTEIALQVEMSKEESALYEALRRDAVEKFQQSDQPQGNRQLQILAEITRLRRACCNPALVLKAGAPPSSKLALFTNVVQELLDNNHKALVFSQFVDHLTIIREKLDSLGIKYQYLDGSTPPKERRKRVAEFQSGVGDIFLISLKAGGVGLNLTAADYVIHMDPWWNPAVEDQASDRAHRIGQKRPVTVYRMITKNTIEEKIVALHKGKRDLADNLLAGTNVAGKVNMEELLSLLKED